MAVTLNANTSTGFIATSDTSGVLQLQTGGTAAVSIGTDQSVNFAATGQRITGDFSNATVANRVMFQTSTVSGNTRIGILPNTASGGTAGPVLYSTNDPANASSLDIRVTDGIHSSIQSDKIGTGTYLPMTFYTGGTESLRLSNTSKAVILAGGSTSANGTGITFPATQSASSDVNTLDDYEEGTWTPTLLSTGATFSYPRGQYGSYCKVGGLVYAQFYIGADASGTTSNYCQIASLPFTSANLSALGQSSGTGWVSRTTPLAFTQGNNTTTIDLWVQNDGLTLATASQVGGGYIVGFTIYRAS